MHSFTVYVALAKVRLTAVLVQLEEWDAFDVNRVAQLTQGRPLEAVTLEALHRFDLLEKLKLPREKLRSFLRVSCLPTSFLWFPLNTG